jgi:hypothetical protein
MDDQTKHGDTFPEPVFSSRVLRARMLIEASGLRFVWDETKGEFVLSTRGNNARPLRVMERR